MDFLKLVHDLEVIYGEFGYILIFIASVIESSPLGWITPGGFILAGGGFFAYSKTLSLFLVIVSGLLGTWVTPFVGYWIGRKTGMTMAKKFKLEKKVDKARRIIDRHGRLILTTSLLSNATRFWISYAAGMQRYDLKKFIFYSGITSLSWVSLWSMAGYLAGGERISIERTVARLQFMAWIILLLALISIYVSAKKEHKEL